MDEEAAYAIGEPKVSNFRSDRFIASREKMRIHVDVLDHEIRKIDARIDDTRTTSYDLNTLLTFVVIVDEQITVDNSE